MTTNRKSIIIDSAASVDGYVVTYDAISESYVPKPSTGGVVAPTVTDVSDSNYAVSIFVEYQRYRMLQTPDGYCNVTLPADSSLVDGSEWTFKDVDGYATDNAYIVYAGTNTTIDRAISFTLPQAYTALSIVYHELSKNWEII